MSMTNRGSVYDKIINEDWFSTPDMGDYYNNYIYKLKADSQSDKKGNTEFFVEDPPTENAGYHPDLSVVAIKANPQAIYSRYMDDYHTSYNIFDGDTIKLSLNEVSNKMIHSEAFLKESLTISLACIEAS